MTTKERCVFVVVITTIILITICSSVDASNWDYHYDDYYHEPVEIYHVYPTIPGTDIRDYSQPGYHIEVDRFGNEAGYPTIPGTDMRDYNRPGYRINRR